MRPCRRRPSQPRRRSARAAWWWLVAASVLLLVRRRRDARDLVGAPRARRAPRATACSATSRASGSTSATPTWRSTAARPRSRSAASTASPSARPADETPLGRRTARCTIVSRCPDQVLGSCRASYRLAVPDNVPLEIQTSSGSVSLTGVRAIGRSTPAPGAIAADRLLRLPAARELGHRRRRARSRVLRRPARAALAQRRRARGRPGRPLPDRRAERLRHRPHPRPHRPDRRAVPDPGAEHERRRHGRGRVVTAALDLSPHLRAARRALLYLVVGLGQGLTYLLVIGGGLLLGVVLAPLWVGLPILAGTARLDLAAGRGRAPAGQPPAGDAPAAGRAAVARRDGVRAQLGNRPFWRAAAMLLLKLPVALVGPASSPACPSLLAIALAGLGVSGLAGEDGRLVGPWALGPARRPRAVPARAAGDDRLDRRARGRRRGAARARPPAAALARGRGRPGARAAGRAARRPLAEHRLLAARARDLRRRRGPPGRAPRSRLRPRVDRGRPRRRARGGDRPRRRARRLARARHRRRLAPPRWRSTTSA